MYYSITIDPHKRNSSNPNFVVYCLLIMNKKKFTIMFASKKMFYHSPYRSLAHSYQRSDIIEKCLPCCNIEY